MSVMMADVFLFGRDEMGDLMASFDGGRWQFVFVFVLENGRHEWLFFVAL
jgi:hypothetical protein